jgi:hypothetical protein
MVAFHAYAQPIQDWAKELKDTRPQCERTEGPSHVDVGGGDALLATNERERSSGTSHVEDGGGEARRLIQVWIFNRNEPSYLPVQDSAMHFQKRLDVRLWFAMNEGPQVWIEVPEELDMRGRIVIHDGHKWRGEELVELGFYEIRFRLRGDADVSTSKRPMKTRSQRAAAEAKKASNPAPTPSLNVD